jgi:hypothetical protein
MKQDEDVENEEEDELDLDVDYFRIEDEADMNEDFLYVVRKSLIIDEWKKRRYQLEKKKRLMSM